MIKQEIIELLKHTDTEEIHSFISELAEKDTNFYNKIKQALLPANEENICNIGHYRAKAENCYDFYDYRGKQRYDYNFYQAAHQASSQLAQLLDDAIFFVEHKKYADAAAIAMSVAEVIPRNYEKVDDSSGKLGGRFCDAIQILCDIVNNSNVSISIKKEIYEWCKEETNESIYSDYGLDYIERIYDLCCELLGDTNEVLANFDKKIENSNSYYLGEIVQRKIRFMLSRNIDIESIIQKYIHIDGVRRIKFEELKNAQKYREALLLAVQGIEIATQKDYYGTILNWQEAIYDIYLLQGDVEKILQMAEYLVLNAGWRSNKKDFYDTLKKYTPPANWNDTLERLLTNAETKRDFDDFSARIMQEHQLWQRLFNYCKKGSIREMEEYEKDLMPYFENEILKYYHDYAEKQALHTDYNSYHEVARILKRMRAFADGNLLVEQLLEKFRTTYKRRKNMMIALESV